MLFYVFYWCQGKVIHSSSETVLKGQMHDYQHFCLFRTVITRQIAQNLKSNSKSKKL